MAKHALVHTDGASKGNPGRAGVGVVIYLDNELAPAVTLAERLPDCTNNVAEYTGLLRGLTLAQELGVQTVEIRTDSELMAKQISGAYAVKAPDLIPLYELAKRYMRSFHSAKVIHVRRGFNAVADELANVGVSLPHGKKQRIEANLETGLLGQPSPAEPGSAVDTQVAKDVPIAKPKATPLKAVIHAPDSQETLPFVGSSFVWLGHSTICWTTCAGTRILVDPWTISNPACPPSWHHPEIDFILITHGHNDHMQDAVALQKSSGCTIVAIAEICDWLASEGVPASKLQPMNRGGSIPLVNNTVIVSMVPAVHSSTFMHNDTPIPMGEAAGFVVASPGEPAVYFAGDTAVFSDMQLISALYQPEVAFLPIGDRFTMGPEQAAYALGLLSSVKTVIPIHYGTFALLTGTPTAFKSACDTQKRTAQVCVPTAGEPLVL